MKKVILSLLVLCCFVFGLTGCGDDSNVIKVGASATPHAEILREASSLLKDKGYTLKVVEYDDYVLPNLALASGELDANYFQHQPYLTKFNASNKTDIVSAGAIHYEPFGLYGKGVQSVDKIPSGAKILVPNDDSNQTRALLLLAQEGLITIHSGKNIDTGITTFDIENNGYDVVSVDANLIPAQFKTANDGILAVINGNYALEAKIDINTALAVEDATGVAAFTYANIIACQNGNENSEKIKALVEVLQSQQIKDYITNHYQGAVLPL